VAQKLNKLGYGNVQALLGGYEAWKKEGYPVQKTKI